mmetsp:Transcript_47767/g.139316  ORF Transcript_47767/g.139316 Transcript_47767/m.139316 type:complete len:285 (+) Transcript_47767:1053-1907(+)
MATVVPRKRPKATQPYEPKPRTTHGLRIMTSAVGTSQCSLTPMSTSVSNTSRTPALEGSVQTLAKRSMSLKTFSVAVEPTTLATALPPKPASPASEGAGGVSSSAMVCRFSGDMCSSLWVCSTWPSPTRKQVSAPLTPRMASCARTDAKDSSKATGIDCTSNKLLAFVKSSEKCSRSDSATRSAKSLPCTGWPKNASCFRPDMMMCPPTSRRIKISSDSHDISSNPRATMSRSVASCIALHLRLACISCRRPPTCKNMHNIVIRKPMWGIEAGIVVPMVTDISG